MNDLLNQNTVEVKEFFQTLETMQGQINDVISNFRPLLNGEIYLSGDEVCRLLRITKRTLQQYRDDGLLPYIQLTGKILYKQSDILTVLERNYVSNKPKENK